LPLRRKEYKSLAWSSSIWMSGSSLVISAESWLCIHFSTRRWSREALWTAFRVTMCTIAFLNRQPQVCFWERFLPWGILCPPPPQVHTFMKHPKFWTTFSTTLWRINDDFGSLPIQGLVKRYNGVKVVARLQTKAYVDRMHALSPLYILIIGKNLTDNSPGYWLCWCKIRIIPCQFSVAWSWKISILLSKSRNRGRSKLWRFT